MILMHWRTLTSIGQPEKYWGFVEAANALSLPLIHLNDSPSSIAHCLSAGNVTINLPLGKEDNITVAMTNAIFRDGTHPTRFGELLAARMLGHIFEEAYARYIDMPMLPTPTSKSITPAVPISQYGSASIPYCYKTLNFTVSDLDDARISSLVTGGKEMGNNICLHPIYLSGFVLRKIKSTVKNKVWWEGNNPGSKIEFYLQEPCTEIMIFHNLRMVTMGMVRVEIDGVVLGKNQSDLSDGVIDGWFPGLWWLPKERGHLVEKRIAHNLPRGPHRVRLTIIDATNSLDNGHKFDFVALAGL